MIRVILLLAVAAAVAVLIRGHRGVRHQALRRLLLALFAVGAALSLLFPSAWTWAAGALDVGRGTDLLLYLLIVAFLGTVATSYVRFQELQHQVTVLARQLALASAPPHPGGAGLGPVAGLVAADRSHDDGPQSSSAADDRGTGR